MCSLQLVTLNSQLHVSIFHTQVNSYCGYCHNCYYYSCGQYASNVYHNYSISVVAHSASARVLLANVGNRNVPIWGELQWHTITQNFIKICPTVLELKYTDEEQTGSSLCAFFSGMCREHTITKTNIPTINSFHAGFFY